MEWNSNAPMELLAQMPARLSKSNLEAIQAVIDNDKHICGTIIGRDLCGNYAPFCSLCDKSINLPCAVAYIRMRQAEGIQLEIAPASDEYEPESEPIPDFSFDGINVAEIEEVEDYDEGDYDEEPYELAAEDVNAIVEELVSDTSYDASQIINAAEFDKMENSVEPPQRLMVSNPQKTRIKIATVRRKQHN